MSQAIEEIMEQEEDTQKGKVLTFLIGTECYGIEIKFVTEIIGIQAITQIPELPDYIRGIVNLRGKIIPVMDVRLRFKKPYREYNDRTCIIIIDNLSLSIGLIVDSVAEVITIPEQDIIPPPEAGKSINNRYIKGIGKVGSEVKLLLDCDQLLSHEDVDNLQNIG